MPTARILEAAIFLAKKTKDPLLVSSIPILSNLVAKEIDNPDAVPSTLEQAALDCVKACDDAWFVLYEIGRAHV